MTTKLDPTFSTSLGLQCVREMLQQVLINQMEVFYTLGELVEHKKHQRESNEACITESLKLLRRWEL